VTLPLVRARNSRAVAPATTKLAHRTSDASLAARAPVVPYVVFCTIVRPLRSADRSTPGELTASNPGAGGADITTAIGQYEDQMRDYGYAAVAASAKAEAERGTLRNPLLSWLYRRVARA
jgi:hypothetical protein